MEHPQAVLSDAGHDVKLQADRDAEALILERLAASGYAVLAEERGLLGTLAEGAPYWVVDPLDGTFNYCRQTPICCVAIALMVGDAPVLGVTFDFNRNEMFEAIVGEGARLNGHPMCIAKSRPKEQAVLATGFSVYRQYDQETLKRYTRHFLDYKKVRMIGSAALSMAYVACGRFDIYLDDNAMLWDVAAGVALVQAAGGYATLEQVEGTSWGRVTRAAADPTLLDEPVTDSS
jgi:myo-inositol-1(or 4)-monophosphatase